MKRSLFLFVFVAMSFASVSSIQGALIWGVDASGELVGSRGVDDLITSGGWDYGFSISWDVEVVEGGWVYGYTVDDGRKDISHLIIEVTQDYPVPLVGHNGDILDPEVFTHAGNLEMPESIFGVKIDHGADHISFFSDRAPVYGDFYAKSGFGVYNDEWTFAHNAGLTDHSSMDPYDFIVRPDGMTTVPEPATMAMLGLGLGAAGLARRRKSKRDNAC